jgi:uncharacterized protein
MERKKLSLPLDLKAVNEEGEFEGMASTFDNVDLGGDVIERGAFTEDLNIWRAKKQLPLMTWFHDMMKPIGDFKEVTETNEGLFVRGKLWVGQKATELSRMAHNMLTGTGPKALSIGFSSSDTGEEVRDGERVRTIRKIQLFEIAVVPFGMNPLALVTSAKNSEGGIVDKRTFEKILRDAGLSSRQAKTFISGGYDALTRDASEFEEEEKKGSGWDGLDAEQAKDFDKKLQSLFS